MPSHRCFGKLVNSPCACASRCFFIESVASRRGRDEGEAGTEDHLHEGAYLVGAEAVVSGEVEWDDSAAGVEGRPVRVDARVRAGSSVSARMSATIVWFWMEVRQLCGCCLAALETLAREKAPLVQTAVRNVRWRSA